MPPVPIPSLSPAATRWPSLRALLALVALVAFFFWFAAEMRTHDFIYYDTMDFVVGNTQLHHGLDIATLRYAFTTFDFGMWQPLTWLSHALDWSLFGANPAAHHLINLLLHCANVWLLFLFLRKATGAWWRAVFVAALFAIHPVNVEAVAWTVERKGLLAALFLLLALLAWSAWVRNGHRRAWVAALCCFALGLLAKASIITLPALLLLLDYWPFGRTAFSARTTTQPGTLPVPLWRLLLEKLPFLLVALAGGIATYHAQTSGYAARPFNPADIGNRLGVVALYYVQYLGMLLAPHDLGLLYPGKNSVPLFAALSSGLALLLLSYAAVRNARTHPYGIVGWGWFLIAFLPVIQFLQVSQHGLADRYCYVPEIGIFIVASWGLARLCSRGAEREAARGVCAVAGVVLVVACAVLAMRQLQFWQNSETLYKKTLASTVANDRMALYLGMYLNKTGRETEALHYLQEAIRIDRANTAAYYSTNAMKALRRNDLVEALKELQNALLIVPEDTWLRTLSGAVLLQLGQPREAAEAFRQTLERVPADPAAREGLARAQKHIDAAEPPSPAAE